MDEKERKEAEATLLLEMQVTAARMRELIVGMPPHDLLGYIYAQHMLKAIADKRVSAGKQPEADGPDDLINQNQFLLEYVHAVLASDTAPDEVKFDEATCAELFEFSRKLRDQAMLFAMQTLRARNRSAVFWPRWGMITQAKAAPRCTNRIGRWWMPICRLCRPLACKKSWTTGYMPTRCRGFPALGSASRR